MQQGRNALITAGTGVVVFCNVKNIFHNLKCLADSIICNLEKRRISLNTTPFDNYIRAIKWLYEQGQIKFGVGDLKLITVESDFNIKASNSTEMLQKKLKSARHQLETIATKVSKLLDTVSYLGHKLLPALGILLILISTALCIRRYLHRKNKKCDNVFITKHFIVFDEHQKQQGKPGLLPLNRSERKQYIIIPSMHLTANEVKRMGLFLLPVITHIIIWTVFIAIDYLLYWLISAISKHLQDLPVLEIPLKLAYNVKGSTSIEDLSYRIPLFETDCLPKPELSVATSWIPLSVIIVVLVMLGILSAKTRQLSILVLSLLYPNSEMERVKQLHEKLLKKRKKKTFPNPKKKLSMISNMDLSF
ncbi:dendritic cell-specific transmembrane protein [Latimeria chalumnae]|uniref:dendritic cell-specific transmembrane protein n=1 Tax=Latimeria chalumnae TaxID=7897 RepID=UPI00313AB601